MATKTSPVMDDMMRTRRAEMAQIPDDTAYDGPPPPNDEAPKEDAAYKVAAPGEPSTGDQFEYEPMIDIEGAWVVYPPGVPCDDTEYRVTMDAPAGADDFAGMKKALDEAGASNPEPAVDEAGDTPVDSEY